MVAQRRSSVLPAAAALCAGAFFWRESPLFVAPASQPEAQRSVHMMCKPVAGTNVLASADSAAIVASRPASNGVAAHFMVKLQTPEGEQSFECPDDTYILDQAEEEGLELPYSCRAGSCSSCAGKVISGSIDQSDQAFLDDDQMGEGYCLTCVTYATSDVTLKTHCEDEL